MLRRNTKQAPTNEKQEQEKVVEPPKKSSKFADLSTRVAAALVMLGIEALFILGGHYALFVELMILQFIAFHELIKLSEDKEKQKTISFGIKAVPYLMLSTISYFISAKRVLHYFINDAILNKYHSITCFSMLCLILIIYVIGLTPENDTYAYKRFAYGLCGSIVIGVPLNLFASIAQRSLFWFIIPITCVIFNDTNAYFCGRFFGKHPLIKLSPKKTWEGFIGALITTCIIAWYLPKLLAHPLFYCSDVKPFDFECTCDAPHEFVEKSYTVFGNQIKCLPAQIHSLIMSLFASLIAPFGGFFASGLKRALNIKDFSNLIPGHGGILDRIDCQLVMGTFAVLYYKVFVQ